ncbi:hypothetical protein GE21DRAFT_1130058, partial [Neurospora crassa]
QPHPVKHGDSSIVINCCCTLSAILSYSTNLCYLHNAIATLQSICNPSTMVYSPTLLRAQHGGSALTELALVISSHRPFV